MKYYPPRKNHFTEPVRRKEWSGISFLDFFLEVSFTNWYNSFVSPENLCDLSTVLVYKSLSIIIIHKFTMNGPESLTMSLMTLH